MKMTTGSLKVLASSEVMLLLYLATTSTTLVPVGGLDTSATGTPTDDAIEACMVEVTNCEKVDTCYSCMRADTTSASEALACFEAAGLDEVESSTATCEHLVAGVCCFDLVSEFECLENDQFVEYWTCFLEVKGCSEEEFTCDHDADIGSGIDDDASSGVDDDANIGSGADDDVGSDADDDVDLGSGVGDDGTDDGNDDGDADSTEGASNGSASTSAVCYGSTLVVSICFTVMFALPPQRA